MYIYLHVPFCLSRCIYCDFFVVLEKSGGQEAYVDAVLREIDRRFESIPPEQGTEIRTLYVGGGTPSLLPAKQYQRIFNALQSHLSFAPDAEVTLEANPGTGRSEMADDPARYLEVGFNRVSVGIQSLNDDELKKLSRIHSGTEAEAFVRALQQAGWGNISVDLMYAIPLQTMASWQHTLQRVIDLNVQHISMYGLKVEEGTPLARLADLPGTPYALPSDDENVAMYFEGIHRLQTAGFERYEFSNLARPGYASRHNLNYWNNGEFLALGASAHGYWQGMRYENVRDLKAYLDDPTAGTATPCPPQEQLENAIIFGLRKAEGIDIPTLEQKYGIDFDRRYGAILAKYGPDYLQRRGDRLVLTEAAIPVSNAILSEFLDA